MNTMNKNIDVRIYPAPYVIEITNNSLFEYFVLKEITQFMLDKVLGLRFTKFTSSLTKSKI